MEASAVSHRQVYMPRGRAEDSLGREDRASHSSPHTQVLLAMMGKGGALVSITPAGSMVSKEVDFLLEQEREMVGRAAQTGHSFSLLEDFTERVRSGGKSGLREGLYIRALAAGIDEVLDVYRSMVLGLEREALADPTMPLTRVGAETADWELLLPALCKVGNLVEGVFMCFYRRDRLRL